MIIIMKKKFYKAFNKLMKSFNRQAIEEIQRIPEKVF